jgi:DNA-binding NtrC family response regulator
MTTDVQILILDDERIVCDRLKPVLEKLGYQVEALTDSKSAVERLSKGRIDVLVTDLKMPGIGGIDVLKFVRDQRMATKVVVISGFATTETARQAMELGAVAFLPKPFKLSQLRDLVVKLAGELRQRPSGQ